MERSRQSSKARERRLRAKYRRNIRIAIVLSLVIGLAGGFVLGRLTVKKDISVVPTFDEPDGTPAIPSASPTAEPAEEDETPAPSADTAVTLPTATATAEPTPEPTPESTPEPQTAEVIVPFGEEQVVPVQLYADGTVRKDAAPQAYETLNFAFRVTRYLTPEYYQSAYGSTHNLTGTEAGVEFELMLQDYTGTQVINPNAALTVGVESESGVAVSGYKLVDAEIVTEKKTLTLTTNVSDTLYKRYAYDANVGDMKYMVVTSYVDGACTQYKFELGEPVRPTATPAPTVYYPTLTKGTESEEVRKLQNRLIELGYLQIDESTTYYGSMTEDAVRKAQAAFGLSETGEADSALQQKLFGEGQ